MGFDPLSIAGTIGAGLVNNLFASDRQDDAQAFSAQQFASRYQTTVKDMQAAGLNPMLAYSQGGGVAPTSSAASSAGMGDVGATINQGKVASAQEANIRADTVNKEAQTANIDADTAMKRADTFLKVAQESLAGVSADESRQRIDLMQNQAREIAERIKNIPKEGDRLDALVKNLGQEYKLLIEKTHNTAQATQQIKWLAVKTMLESDLAGFDVQAAKDLGNLGREAGQLKPVIDAVLTAAQIFGTRKTSSTVHSTSNSTVTHKQGK